MINETLVQAGMICKQHPNCKGCPMAQGKPLNIGGMTTMCETGKAKENNQ